MGGRECRVSRPGPNRDHLPYPTPISAHGRIWWEGLRKRQPLPLLSPPHLPSTSPRVSREGRAQRRLEEEEAAAAMLAAAAEEEDKRQLP